MKRIEHPALVSLLLACLMVPVAATAQDISFGETGTSKVKDNAGGMCLFDRTQTFWDILVCEVFEEIPLIYPDTNTCYLMKDVPPNENVAYRIDMTLPYATFSSTVTYQDTKPVAQLRGSEYLIPNPDFYANGGKSEKKHWWNGHGWWHGWWDDWNNRSRYLPNPYNPGNLIDTPKDQRQVTLYVTPASRYQETIESGVPDCQGHGDDRVCNVVGIGTTETRNLIFQRVYYPNRSNPNGRRQGERFYAFSDYARNGYTLPRRLQCVDPRRPNKAIQCPHYEPFNDFPVTDFRMPDVAPDGGKIEDTITFGRPTPPQPPGNCPNRQRWDRPELEYVHWAGPGSLGASGEDPPDPATTCTGYLITLLAGAKDAIYMTRVDMPPTFFNVHDLEDDPDMTFPDPEPDLRYVGIQNYGALGGDVRYPEQSRSVGDIVKFCKDVKGERCQARTNNERYSWIFLHYTRPLQSPVYKELIEEWGKLHDVNVNQLAIYIPELANEIGQFRHPPFLIYRNKQRRSDFTEGYTRERVGCYSFENPHTGEQQDWNDAPLSYASDGRAADDQSTTCDPQTNPEACGMEAYTPITIRCGYGGGPNDSKYDRPGPEFLDACLENLLSTDSEWGTNRLGRIDGSNCKQPNDLSDM